MDAAVKDLRLDQSLCELKRLQTALKKWKEDRKLADIHKGGKYRAPYQTQVSVLVDRPGRNARPCPVANAPFFA
jgi:hypothetical protein